MYEYTKYMDTGMFGGKKHSKFSRVNSNIYNNYK